MGRKVLVTGGAGFIGSHIADLLVKEGNEVVVLDNLDRQVHLKGKKPDYLNEKVKFIEGDVRKSGDLKKAMEGAEVVFHEAAAVGVGQSMYEVRHYVDVNCNGTASLLDFLVNEENEVKKILVAGSMSSYGEGAYECSGCGAVEPKLREEEQLRQEKWEMLCPKCGRELKPVPTGEEKFQESNSIYAITKKNQEEMVLNIGKVYGIKAVSLRYFNVFGPRQSLSNPYTGVAAIFLSRVKNSHPPIIYEDGLQTRDFIFVGDIARANLLAMESNSANYEAFNVGSGNGISIWGIAEEIINGLGSKLKPEVTGNFRKGDVRHCFADISKIKAKLGFSPEFSFAEGMRKLIEWSETAEAVDGFEEANKELKNKGLV